MALTIHELEQTRKAIADIYDVRQQWEDGLIHNLEMIHKVDNIMIEYLRLKDIVDILKKQQ